MKLKTDAQGHACLQDGLPIYIDGSGKEVVYDAAAATTAFSKLSREVKGHRERAEAAEARLAVLNETVEPRLGQQLLKLVLESVPRRTRHLRPGRNEIALHPGLTSHRHRRNPIRISMFERIR